MALTAGSTVTQADMQTLRDDAASERSRRSLSSSTYPLSNYSVGEVTDDGKVNQIINLLNAINSTTTGFSTVSAGNLMNAINKLRTACTTFKGKKQVGNDSGCKSGCLGLCQGCNNTCTGGCEGAECQGNGCYGHCSGGCGTIFQVDLLGLMEVLK